MVYKTAFNPTDSPVVVDAEGHVVGGFEWGTVKTTDAEAKAALDAGRLVIVETSADASGLNDQARDALTKTEELVSGGTKQTTSRKRGPNEEG